MNEELLSIGEAAGKLGLNTSALRYYEERGLVHPERQRGQRVYAPEEMRRLAFIRIMHRLGLDLDTASSILDQPNDRWHSTARDQIAALEELIAVARGAQKFLTNALDCPADHPTHECPYMIEALDRLLAGATFEQLAAEYA